MRETTRAAIVNRKRNTTRGNSKEMDHGSIGRKEKKSVSKVSSSTRKREGSWGVKQGRVPRWVCLPRFRARPGRNYSGISVCRGVLKHLRVTVSTQ